MSGGKGHSGEFSADLVSAEPELMDTELAADDEFLILACDGLWDVLDSQEAVDIIRNDLLNRSAGAAGAAGGSGGPHTRRRRGTTSNVAQAAAQNLATQALRLGSSDNVTVVVVMLAC